LNLDMSGLDDEEAAELSVRSPIGTTWVNDRVTTVIHVGRRLGPDLVRPHRVATFAILVKVEARRDHESDEMSFVREPVIVFSRSQ